MRQNGRIGWTGLLLLLALLLAMPAWAEDMATVLERDGFLWEDADGDGTISTGDIVFFGRYPQSQVTDGALLDALNGLLRTDAWQDAGF